MGAGPGWGRVGAVLAFTVGAGCATVDPPVATGRPDHALGLALSSGLVQGQRDAASRMAGPGWMGGLDLDYRHGVLGLQTGIRSHGEGRAVRTSWLTEAQVQYLAQLGVGVRLGWLNGTPSPIRPRRSTDLTFSLGIPMRLGAAWTLIPYARPGFRFLANARGDNDLRGFHEFGLTLRWTFERF